MQSDKTIFVSIASYRDPELQFTVDTLFDHAKFPDRIKVVICQQEDKDHFISFDKFGDKVTSLNYHYVESQGVCWARYQIFKQYAGQDYFMQLDSHIALEKHWDELLTNQIAIAQNIAKNQKVLLSAYPSAYDVIDGKRTFDKKQHPKSDARLSHNFKYLNARAGLPNNTGRPCPSAYVNAGFMFGVGSFITECGYDPEIYFEGEELLNTLKAFTRGYDFFNPSVHMCWHLYKRWEPEARKRWGYQHHREEDDKQRDVRYWERSKRSHEKLEKIFRGEMLEVLGTVRTIKDYESYVGSPILKTQK